MKDYQRTSLSAIMPSYAYINWGKYLARQGDMQGAISKFETSTAMAQQIPEAYINLGLVYATLKDYKRAGKNFRKAIRLDRNSAKAHSLLASILMEENNVENIKETMQNGNFFMVTRNLRENDVNDIGPDEAFDVIDEIGMAYPMFTKVAVDGHKITVAAKDADKVQFIANGKVIKACKIGSEEVTLDLDTIEGAEDFLYVRAEIFGEGGLTITQALTIDNGTEPLEFVEKTGFEAIMEEIITIISSLRIGVIIQEIIRAI